MRLREVKGTEVGGIEVEVVLEWSWRGPPVDTSWRCPGEKRLRPQTRSEMGKKQEEKVRNRTEAD